jgi:hypothetical protein
LPIARRSSRWQPAIIYLPSTPTVFSVTSAVSSPTENDIADNYRRAASYVDRILKGTKPSELAIQAPVKFELVINFRTAKGLGLDVPLQLQQIADEVIE